jgi:hypothetical protein
VSRPCHAQQLQASSLSPGSRSTAAVVDDSLGMLSGHSIPKDGPAVGIGIELFSKSRRLSRNFQPGPPRPHYPSSKPAPLHWKIHNNLGTAPEDRSRQVTITLGRGRGPRVLLKSASAPTYRPPACRVIVLLLLLQTLAFL